MFFLYDEDEFETVITSRSCTVCNGDLKRCNGFCNGSFGVSQVRRSPEAIRKIRAERQKAHEDAVLAEADVIRARRARI
jgi:hypothetical protein